MDGGRPRALSYHYSLPGDEHQASAELFVIDVATGESVQARCEPIFMPFVPAIAYGWVWWSSDQSKVYWLSNDRGDHHGALHHIDCRIRIHDNTTINGTENSFNIWLPIPLYHIHHMSCI